VPLVSNLDGELWAWDTAPTPEYWVRHARLPVRFAAGIGTLRRLGYRTFVEVGPAPTLLGLIGDGLAPDPESRLLPTLRPQVDDWQVLAGSLVQLYVRGAEVDWRGFEAGTPRRRVPLPTYPFRPTSCRPERRWRPVGPVDDLATSRGADPLNADGDPADDHELLYRLVWRPADEPREAVPADAVDRPVPATTWVLLADSTGVADAIAQRLTADGVPHVLARPGAGYAHDGDTAILRPGQPGDLERLLTDVALPGADVAVLHLTTLDPATDDATAGQPAGCLTAVHAAQALTHVDAAVPARLWLITRGAVAACGPDGDDGAARGPAAPGQATVWGLGRSLQQELPGRWGGLVDLDPGAAPETQAAGLLMRLRAETAARVSGAPVEDQLALRDGAWQVARLVHSSAVDPNPDAPVASTPSGRAARGAPLLRRDAAYLITGGLGGLGLHTARWLVRAEARHLVLVGRTALPPRREWGRLAADHPLAARVAAVRELEGLGASVLVEAVDVADATGVTDLLQRLDDEGRPPVRGVVHAAGTGDVAPIGDLDQTLLERDLLPKAVGGWNLHCAFTGRELDFFVLYSSASAVLSSPFVAGYAAANAFLDALAQARRAQGLPGLSIDWGIWEATGLASRGAEATPGLSRGMGTLRPGQAIRVLHRLLAGDLPGHDCGSLAVVPVDWQEWGRRYQEVSGSRLLAELLTSDVGPATSASPRPAGRRASLLPSAADLVDVPVEEWAALLRERLLHTVAATLGTGGASVRADQPLLDLGLDSLMAVELRNDVESRLGVTLPISLLLEGVSVDGIAEHLITELATRSPQSLGAAGRTGGDDLAEQLLSELEALPEAQARSLIGSEDR
jgi:acyl transferase domain-containing protein